jgi:PPK2 family polyphosphate:nucleotide phosphotransferase
MKNTDSKHHRLNHACFRIKPGTKARIEDFDPAYTGGFKDKDEAHTALLEDVTALSAAQELLWATGSHAVLIIFQAMDAAGKDGTIKHVMSGVNPQGCSVTSFKAPSDEERQHPFLWRPTRFLPGGGRIAIFNRSYYEEVLVVRVHPEFLESQWLPPGARREPNDALWKTRFDEINAFEEALVEGGTLVLKFFLNVSRQEQRERFLARLTDKAKQWKFSPADFRERARWDEYMRAYEEMLSATSTKEAPWYVIPADHKWFMRAAVADVITAKIQELDLRFPKVKKETLTEFSGILERLNSERDGEAM